MKTIVYVTVDFYSPEQAGTPGVYEQVKILADAGHRVVVIAGGTSHFSEEVIQSSHLLTQSRVENFEVIRVKGFPDFRRSFVRHALFFLLFSFLSALACFRRSVGRIDYLMTNSSPFFFVPCAYLIATVKGSRLVILEWDLYPETFEAMGVLRNAVLSDIIRSICNAVRRRAHRVIVVSPRMMDLLEDQGIATERIVLIPDAFQVYRYTEHHERPLKKQPDPDCPTAVFVGRFNRINCIDVLVRAAEILAKGGHSIKFEFYGAGRQSESSIKFCQSHHVDSCHFMGAPTTKRIREVLERADVGLIARPGHSHFACNTAGKTYDYLGSGTPIVFSGPLDGDNAQLIREAGAGICVEPMRPDLIATAILSVLADPDRWRNMSSNARAFSCEHFGKEQMKRPLLSLFE